jgi:hypothetical protein
MDVNAGRKKGIGHCRDYLSERRTIPKHHMAGSVAMGVFEKHFIHSV